jgi:hypothetical protein
MTPVWLKLKQASTVLGVPSKDLQNLIQLGVLKPKKRADCYWFDPNLLLQAKVAWHLKESLGVSTKFLTRIIESLSGERANILVTSRLAPGSAAIQIRIPVARLNAEIERQMPLAEVARDLPRGRKRPGWKREFLKSLEEAAGDLGDLPQEDILRAIRDYRKARKVPPEISIATETQKKIA